MHHPQPAQLPPVSVTEEEVKKLQAEETRTREEKTKALTSAEKEQAALKESEDHLRADILDCLANAAVETAPQNPEDLDQLIQKLFAAAEDMEKTAEEETKASAEDEAKEQPFLVQITEDDPSIGYVLVRMPNPVGLLPLPQEGEYKKTIRVAMPDGSEYINVLHITPNGFWMENANCEGQDCVKQGEVTLENREERILWNMIICLPHQLSAELITREEAEQMLR